MVLTQSNPKLLIINVVHHMIVIFGFCVYMTNPFWTCSWSILSNGTNSTTRISIPLLTNYLFTSLPSWTYIILILSSIIFRIYPWFFIIVFTHTSFNYSNLL
jgi:hypothetical protein